MAGSQSQESLSRSRWPKSGAQFFRCERLKAEAPANHRQGASPKSGLLGLGGYRFGRALVFDADLVDLAQIDVFPSDFRVAVGEYNLEILIATRLVRALEQARLVIVKVVVAHAIVAPISVAGGRDADFAKRVAGLGG